MAYLSWYFLYGRACIKAKVGLSRSLEDIVLDLPLLQINVFLTHRLSIPRHCMINVDNLSFIAYFYWSVGWIKIKWNSQTPLWSCRQCSFQKSINYQFQNCFWWSMKLPFKCTQIDNSNNRENGFRHFLMNCPIQIWCALVRAQQSWVQTRKYRNCEFSRILFYSINASNFSCRTTAVRQSKRTCIWVISSRTKQTVRSGHRMKIVQF